MVDIYKEMLIQGIWVIALRKIILKALKLYCRLFHCIVTDEIQQLIIVSEIDNHDCSSRISRSYAFKSSQDPFTKTVYETFENFRQLTPEISFLSKYIRLTQLVSAIQYVTGSAKTRHNHTFLNSILLHIYYLLDSILNTENFGLRDHVRFSQSHI